MIVETLRAATVLLAAARGARQRHLRRLPLWIAVYLEHTIEGRSMRAIARRHNTWPSTVCRQIRLVEDLREDAAFDAQLMALETKLKGTANAA